MYKIISTEFVSLDNVFEAPGKDGTVPFAGWTASYGNEEFMKYKMDELTESDALLLGRITYEGFAQAWPKMKGDPFSDKFNSMPKFVVSSQLQNPTWQNTKVLKNLDEVKELKEQGDGILIVHGSGMLLNGLLKAGLVDEVKLLVYPVVIGQGKKLFADGATAKFKLLEAKNFATGVVALRYSV